MAKKKEQWKPRVNCFLKDMTPISPDNIYVPENHLVYRILTKINQERLQHDNNLNYRLCGHERGGFYGYRVRIQIGQRAGQLKKRKIRFLCQCQRNFGERSSNMGKLNIIEKIAHMLQLQGVKITEQRMEELKS